jgi:hypothetical protein
MLVNIKLHTNVHTSVLASPTDTFLQIIAKDETELMLFLMDLRRKIDTALDDLPQEPPE